MCRPTSEAIFDNKHIETVYTRTTDRLSTIRYRQSGHTRGSGASSRLRAKSGSSGSGGDSDEPPGASPTWQIDATPGHWFYRAGQHRWQAAETLARGQLIAGLQGTQQVSAVTWRQASQPVYNLRVTNGHTYFVRPAGSDAAAGLWVHNHCFSPTLTQLVLAGTSPSNGLLCKRGDSWLRQIKRRNEGLYNELVEAIVEPSGAGGAYVKALWESQKKRAFPGQIGVPPAVSNGGNLRTSILRGGGELPGDYKVQAHHLVNGEAVNKTIVGKELFGDPKGEVFMTITVDGVQRRFPGLGFSVNNRMNGELLPEDDVIAAIVGKAWHKGSHPDWNAAVEEALEEIADRIRAYNGSSAGLADQIEELDNIMERLMRNARNLVAPKEGSRLWQLHHRRMDMEQDEYIADLTVELLRE